MIDLTKISQLLIFNNDFKRKKLRVDPILLLGVILITLYGTLMVFSAGNAYAEARYNDSLYFVKKQTVWLLIGFAVMIAASNINPTTYKKYTPHLYGITLLLLLLVYCI